MPPGSGRASQVTSERWASPQLANYRLRDLGLIANCGADEFYAAGSEEFSEEFRTKAPGYLFDVQYENEEAVSFQQWEEDVGKTVEMIDQDEDQPAPARKAGLRGPGKRIDSSEDFVGPNHTWSAQRQPTNAYRARDESTPAQTPGRSPASYAS